jgi:hypothetical protein
MKHVYNRRLRDEELRSHLEQGDMLTFTDDVEDWHEIEGQIERLGFGDIYAVSRSSRPDPEGKRKHTRVNPLHAQASTLHPPIAAIAQARPVSSSINPLP